MAHAVVRQMCACIRKAEAIAITADGTTDIHVQDQESIVVRYVDEDLVPHEVLGFFAQTNGTTGEALSVMLFDRFLGLVCQLRSYVGKPMMEQAA